MPIQTHPTGAADLLVQGTYALRHALDRLTRSREAEGPPQGLPTDPETAAETASIVRSGPVMGQRGAGSRAQEVGRVFQKLLLAVDGSEHSARAVPVAADIAKKSDAEVVVLHVREYSVARGGPYPLENGLHAKEIVDHVTGQLMADGVRARGVVEPSIVGEAARAILKEAEAGGVDAIVMGSRGGGELAGLLLGSVAHKVIQLSHCPVVVAR